MSAARRLSSKLRIESPRSALDVHKGFRTVHGRKPRLNSVVVIRSFLKTRLRSIGEGDKSLKRATSEARQFSGRNWKKGKSPGRKSQVVAMKPSPALVAGADSSTVGTAAKLNFMDYVLTPSSPGRCMLFDGGTFFAASKRCVADAKEIVLWCHCFLNYGDISRMNFCSVKKYLIKSLHGAPADL